MSMKEHFKSECDLIGWNDPTKYEEQDDYEVQQQIITCVNDVLTVIEEQGHSGHSFPYFFNLLEKAANFKPLTPLTGEDSEWNEVGNNIFQNNRCSNVFKRDGKAYNMEGYVFREPSGACFTSKESPKDVSFPYTPEKPVFLDVSEGAGAEEQAEAVAQHVYWHGLIARLELLPLHRRLEVVAAGVAELLDTPPPGGPVQ